MSHVVEWPIDMFSKVKGPFQGGLLHRTETPLPIGGRHTKKERERKRERERDLKNINIGSVMIIITIIAIQ